MYLQQSLFLLVLIVIGSFGFSKKNVLHGSVHQNESDSLISKEVDSMNVVAFDLVFSNQDTVILLMRENKERAWKNRDTTGYLAALNITGIAYDIRGMLDSSSYYFTKTLELSQLYKRKEFEEKSINNLGMMNWNKGNLFLAQQYFFKALELSEHAKNEKRTSVALSNIGLIYQELFMYEKALGFHRKSLSIRRNNEDLKKVVPLSLNNMAICFEHIGKIDSAIILINEGLVIAREINNKQTEGNLLTTLGNCYIEQQKYQLALKYCLESVEVKIQSGNILNINKTYNSVSDIYLKMGKPQIALEYALKANARFRNSGVRPDWIHYNQLSKVYYSLGNKQLGELNFERANEMKDSIFSQSHAHSFAELEVLHESQQKEADLSQYKIKLTEEQFKVQSRNFYLILLGFGLLTFLILAVGFFKKQKFKKEQFQKELALRDKLAYAETQNQLNNERMRISKDLHDNIGSQLTLVTSSLDNLTYKFNGEDTKLKLTQISEFTKVAIRQLRDSIWALNRNELSVEDFHLRVLDYINKAKQSCPSIKFENRITGNKSQVLTPEQGVNLLYIIQEVINNSIKYAECTAIMYDVKVNGNLVEIKVQDNGKGFSKEEVAIGNGLINIDSRINKINGTYMLDSALGKGTCLLINLKI